MSSRNRRNQGQQDDPLNVFDAQIDETENAPAPAKIPSMKEADGRGYGVPGLMPQQETVKAIALNKIIPDPSQPRRAIPFAVRQKWNGDMQTLYPAWEKLIQDEENGDFSIRKMLEGGDNIRNPEPKPLEAGLMKVIDLALTIQRDGLANPITCVLHGVDTFYLETGERRWLAYHLLLWATGDTEKWKSIPVRTVKQWSVWRQASENNARDNLNAIGKARQLALLIMDLLKDEYQFQPFDAFEQEQDFYAQVADGNKFRIPRGKTTLILSSTSLKNDVQIRNYRALLRLPYVAWYIADDRDIPEYPLRQMLVNAQDEIELIEMLKGYSVSTDTLSNNLNENHTVSTDTLSENQKTPGKRLSSKITRYESFTTKLIPRLAAEVKKLKVEERASAIADLRRLIDELENE